MVPAYNSILVLDGTNTANSVGAIPDSSTTKLMSVTKQNSGTWTLSGNNSYTGATNVTAGTLLVNGSLAAGSVVTVNGSAAVLGGTGTINGPVTITSGTLAPGTSAGTLNIKNTLALGGTSAFELGALASDKVIGVTNMTFGGALNVKNIDATLAEGATFDLFDWTGNRNGQFATITLPTLPASYDWKYFTAPDNTQQQFDYATGQIQVVAVPEPGIVALAGVVGMAALARRHRKN